MINFDQSNLNIRQLTQLFRRELKDVGLHCTGVQFSIIFFLMIIFARQFFQNIEGKFLNYVFIEVFFANRVLITLDLDFSVLMSMR